MERNDPTIKFTKEMFDLINDFRISNLRTRNEFFKESGISGKSTIDYRRKSKRITFNSIKKLKRIGIELDI